MKERFISTMAAVHSVMTGVWLRGSTMMLLALTLEAVGVTMGEEEEATSASSEEENVEEEELEDQEAPPVRSSSTEESLSVSLPRLLRPLKKRKKEN